MNKEAIKSATLTVLILISLFFTWNMWTLRPSFEYFQNQTLVESIPIDQETKKTYEVIKPHQLLLHSQENHFSSIAGKFTNGLWKEMQNWEFSNVKSQSPFLTREEFQKWSNGNNDATIELKFYNEIPMSTFQSMLQWDSDTNENISFDRIFLDVMTANDAQQKVSFVSYDKMIVVETTVNDIEAKDFVAQIFDRRDELQSYFSYDTGQGSDIMLPNNQVILDSYEYFTETIDGEKFKDALFSNPRIVKQDENVSRNRYTDGIRELNIYQNQHMVRYVNPTLRDTDSVRAGLLIDQSISFLNDHGGWTDHYVLFNVNESDQEIEFIMSIQSIPVINSEENSFGPTMIKQRWGQNEIAIYDRPSYQLISNISNQSTTLMSGYQVVELIKNNQQIEETNIHNIFIAYELSSSDSQQFVKVSPIWCIQMKNGQLLKINKDLEQSGGNENGVE
jgi:regulatory protein YycH of two-component signal transduction system YycFG